TQAIRRETASRRIASEARRTWPRSLVELPARNANARFVHSLQEVRPKIAAKFGALQRRCGGSQFLGELLEFLVIHSVTPACSSFFRRIRTARNIRNLTAPTEIPKASPIAL